MSTKIKIDTSDPGKAANAVARAAILFARVSGYIAENEHRKHIGCGLAYTYEFFEYAIQECFPEAAPQAPKPEGAA